MGSVTWLLVPVALLGGVPFPTPVYYTISALKEAAKSLKATTASPCPEEKFVSTDILDSPPRHSRSSTAVASATVAPTTNLGNPRSFLPTFGEMPEETHARTDPSPALVSSQKQMQAKREVKTTKQRYWESLSSAFSTALLKKEAATAWRGRRVTETAGLERQMGSINSPEKSFLPKTTAVGHREVLFLRERLTRRHDGHAKTTPTTTTHAFLRPKGLVETSLPSTATTNKTILDVNEYQATAASSDTDDMRVADVLMQRLRTAGGRREGSAGFERTTYAEPTTGSGNAVLVAEINDLTSSTRPQTAGPIQPSTLAGNAVPISTRVPYESIRLPTTHQAVEASADPVSPEREDIRDVEVHENLSTQLSQLITPGNDEVTEPLKTGPESEASTPVTTWAALSTSANDVSDNSYANQASSAEDMYPSGTSAGHGLTPEETTSVAPVFTEKITQPDSLPVTSADLPVTEREISDIITTSTQTSPAEMWSTNEARVISQSAPPDQDTTTEKPTTYTTSPLKSRETVVTTPGDVESVTTGPGRPLSTSNSSNPLAGGLPKPGINPKDSGRRQPEVMHSTEPPEAYPSVNGVRVRLGLDADYGACVRGREWQFREHIRRQLSVLLRVPLPGVRNVRVLPGSIIVEADMVPVKTPLLEVDRSALLAARTDLQDRIDKGTVVVTDLDGNRLPIFTSTVYSLQPPRGSSYSPALLGALTAMFFGATSVIVASAYLVRRHVREGHVSPSPEAVRSLPLL
ncbi:hypothetical protein HPB50_009480 [Hyalomma asiaticum]|uniref:Uncharacterized protein n=1 Tax=Hyalomma asiaticum TaxID=266040 RepID=A0ACB7T703_HYAAI|nr:hypothetical protein HPB50_009480 [Hyalomma asiaticum]